MVVDEENLFGEIMGDMSNDVVAEGPRERECSDRWSPPCRDKWKSHSSRCI